MWVRHHTALDWQKAQAKGAEKALSALTHGLNSTSMGTTTTALGLPEGATYSLVHLKPPAQGGQLSSRSRYLQAHVRVPEHPGHAGLVEGEGEGEAWGKTETLLGHHTVRPGRLLACSRSPFQLCVLRGVDVWTVLGLVQSRERPV